MEKEAGREVGRDERDGGWKTAVFASWLWRVKEDRRERTEDRGQRTKDKGQRTKDKGQRTKDKGQIPTSNV
jgi:hypothetical protein